MIDDKKPPERMYSRYEIVKNKFVPCSLPTLRRWIVQGHFPPGRRCGRRVFWSESDIKEWQSSTTRR
jgi:predicted DNA-binding transcriptional regulator AlpA